MSQIFFKERDQPFVSDDFLRKMYEKNRAGGLYCLLEVEDGSYETFECGTIFKVNELINRIQKLKDSGIHDKRMIGFFISTNCSLMNNEMENAYTATHNSVDGDWITIIGDGDFKYCKGGVSDYVGPKKFVHFCKQAFFSQEHMLSAGSIFKALTNLESVVSSNNSFLIVGSKNKKVFHNLVLDEELGIYNSNDSHLGDFEFNEKAFILNAILFSEIQNKTLKETPHSRLEKLKLEPLRKIRSLWKQLQEQGVPSFK